MNSQYREQTWKKGFISQKSALLRARWSFAGSGFAILVYQFVG